MPVFLRWFLNLSVLNPIAVRLVQNGSRRTRHLYIRSAYLAVLIIALLWLLIIKTNSGGPLGYRELASAAYADRHLGRATALLSDGHVYHAGGGSEAQELAAVWQSLWPAFTMPKHFSNL